MIIVTLALLIWLSNLAFLWFVRHAEEGHRAWLRSHGLKDSGEAETDQGHHELPPPTKP